MADIKNVNSEEKALMGGKAWGRLDGGNLLGEGGKLIVLLGFWVERKGLKIDKKVESNRKTIDSP
jgi:hypothetical protein